MTTDAQIQFMLMTTDFREVLQTESLFVYEIGRIGFYFLDIDVEPYMQTLVPLMAVADPSRAALDRRIRMTAEHIRETLVRHARHCRTIYPGTAYLQRLPMDTPWDWGELARLLKNPGSAGPRESTAGDGLGHLVSAMKPGLSRRVSAMHLVGASHKAIDARVLTVAPEWSYAIAQKERHDLLLQWLEA